MKLIAIEASSLVASAAILDGDTITAEYTVNHKKTHSQTLLPMLDEIVRMTETDLRTVDAVAVSGGPGSFTGLRIGAATAKGLGLALDIPLVHVPTLDATAYNIYGSGCLVCPVMDARRSQVYNGLYRFDGEFTVVQAARALDMNELIGELDRRGEEVIFLGDGVPVYRQLIEETLKTAHRFAPAHLNRQRAAAVAALGALYYAQGRTVSAAEMVPDYLRKSQAERELEEGKLHVDP